ncbi:hypothetical protein BOX15_Mlig032767g1, partial [Macrostomum lignano]
KRSKQQLGASANGQPVAKKQKTASANVSVEKKLPPKQIMPDKVQAKSKKKQTMNLKPGKKAKQSQATRHIENPLKQPGVLPPKVRSGGDAVKKSEWTNRQRLLTVASRGVSYLGRHLLKDFQALLPQAKSDSKFAGKDQLILLNEIAEMRNASHVMYVETRRKQDLYMWISRVGTGPSVKFLVENVHTMSELKLTGNCLKGSRHIVAFDSAFESNAQLRLVKELFTQVFNVPRSHPRSKPFVDHVMLLAWLDGRIWLRNYQIVNETGDMAEIGPRCVLRPIRIWSGSFTGPCLFDNPAYVPPPRLRANNSSKYVSKLQAKMRQRLHSDLPAYIDDPTDQVFQ